MSSTRLTKEMREAVALKIIEDTIGKNDEKIEKRRNDFSVKVYNTIYPKTMRDKMYALPDGWLPESDSFMVQFGASSMGYCRRALTEKKRFLASHKHSHSQCIAVYDDAHPLTKEHDEITKALYEQNEKKRDAYSKTMSILNSCHTTKQLKDLWPEVAKYIEGYEPKEERTTAIVPVTGELNALLGLKTKAA